jgi:hypothetical protein
MGALAVREKEIGMVIEIQAKVFVGVDPGKAGGIAALNASGRVMLACKMPETDADLLSCIETIQRISKNIAGHGGPPDVEAVIERVSSGIFGGGMRMGVKSAFTFGEGFGRLKMAFIAAGVPYQLVMPGKWQRALGCLSKGDKNVTKRRAQERFANESIKITHAIADALLIAEYCRVSSR